MFVVFLQDFFLSWLTDHFIIETLFTLKRNILSEGTTTLLMNNYLSDFHMSPKSYAVEYLQTYWSQSSVSHFLLLISWGQLQDEKWAASQNLLLKYPRFLLYPGAVIYYFVPFFSTTFLLAKLEYLELTNIMFLKSFFQDVTLGSTRLTTSSRYRLAFCLIGGLSEARGTNL